MQEINQEAEDVFPKWLWPKTVARELGIDASTLWRWVQSGQIKAVKIGKRTRFDPAEVELVKEQRNRLARIYLEMHPNIEQKKAPRTRKMKKRSGSQ